MLKNNLNVKFSYSKEDEFLANQLKEYLYENSEKIFNFFNIDSINEPLEIRIIPTKKEYDEINKKRRKIDSIPKWSIGNYHDNIIEYVSLNDYKNTSHAFPIDKYEEQLEYYKKTFVHEFTHFVLISYIRDCNSNPLKYLNEGLAQYLSGQRDDMKLIFNYSLEEILSNNCYPGWYLMTRYIIEEYGKEYFIKLIKDNDLANKETPRLYEEVKNYYKEDKQKLIK